MKKRRKKISKLDQILEIPKEVYSEETRLSCLGFHELLIENYKSILDYQEIYIRVYTYTGILGVVGRNLEMTQMTEDDLKITGEIEKIEFEKSVEED